MRKLSVLFLKIAIVSVALPIILLAGYGLYWLSGNPVSPTYAPMLYPIIVGIYVSLIPLIWSFHQLYKLLDQAIRPGGGDKEGILKNLRKGSLFFAGIFLLTEPFVFQAAQQDDAPGLILFFMIPVFFALVMSAFLTLFITKEDIPKISQD